MLTLYTAVGKLQIRKNSAGKEYPLVMVGEKERTLTPYEMLLWSSCLLYTSSQGQVIDNDGDINKQVGTMN